MSEGPEGVSVAVKTHPSTQEALLRLQGDRFFRTPYIGQHGWVSLWAEGRLEPDELAELVAEAYERAAPEGPVRRLREE